jgi:adenine-specific DNA methylase
LIPKECKRLAEVDFPIAVVSKHAAREKSIRHGHPSTLHLWWARRPLASSRAVLLALLLPDPCDAHCPKEFKAVARGLLPRVGCGSGKTDEALRQGLLKFIGDFANWDLAAQPTYLEVARGLVKAAHPEETPLVVDPFAGGGSIPLEALRLGCDAFASDLNPVACLILKVMLEDIPRHGPGLADELRKAGAEIKRQAEKELADFYPPDPDGARPIAYLWARTVRCESPDCGAEIPLVRSFWLSKKASRRRALRPKVVRPRGGTPHVEFEIFEPRTEDDVPKGTVSRAKATCPCCERVLAPERVRAQLAAQRGGADTDFDDRGHRTGGARLLAVVTLKDGEAGRQYRLPAARDYEAVRKAQQRVATILREWERGGRNGLCPVPDEPTPAGGGSGAGRAFSVQRYGMLKWGDLFTARQKFALTTLVAATKECSAGVATGAASLCLSRLTARNSSLCLWLSHGDQETVWTTFGRNALPIVWDFAEAVPISSSSGSFVDSFDVAWKAVTSYPEQVNRAAQVQQADASDNQLLPDDSAGVWFTDPPYYDAIPYADLADFFLVWMKRILPNEPLLHDVFDTTNPLSPKDREAVQDETKSVAGRPKDRTFFEATMARAFAEGRRVLQESGVGSVVFAHKTTEGWEALLAGIIAGRWTITGSWPIATERTGRPRAHSSAALATSIHLVCRPRPDDAQVGDWGGVLRELPRRVAEWMQRLQSEHVRGADLVFACIGPALEIFSRYARVETADGREVPLAEYLEKVWEVVGRAALEQVLSGASGALEEDARLTALFLWTLQSSNGVAAEAEDEDGEETEDDEDDGAPTRKKAGGYSLVFDVARRFAQPLGIHLPVWENRIIETEKGVVRLLPVAERATQLFGRDGAQAVARDIEASPAAARQMQLFPDDAQTVAVKPRGRRKAAVGESPAEAPRQVTTLDRVHAAMLLQRAGKTNALRNLLKAEQERGGDFLRLANALSALYPRDSEEKRLLDAMLLAVPR